MSDGAGARSLFDFPDEFGEDYSVKRAITETREAADTIPFQIPAVNVGTTGSILSSQSPGRSVASGGSGIEIDFLDVGYTAGAIVITIEDPNKRYVRKYTLTGNITSITINSSNLSALVPTHLILIFEQTGSNSYTLPEVSQLVPNNILSTDDIAGGNVDEFEFVTYNAGSSWVLRSRHDNAILAYLEGLSVTAWGEFDNFVDATKQWWEKAEDGVGAFLKDLNADWDAAEGDTWIEKFVSLIRNRIVDTVTNFADEFLTWWDNLDPEATDNNAVDSFFAYVKTSLRPIIDWAAVWESDTRASDGTGDDQVDYADPANPTNSELSTGANVWWRRVFRGINNWWNDLDSSSTGGEAFFYFLKELGRPAVEWFQDIEVSTRAPAAAAGAEPKRGEISYSDPPTVIQLTTGPNIWWRRIFRGITNWWNGLSSTSTGADAFFYRLKEVVTPITDWLLDWEQDTRAPSGTGAGQVNYADSSSPTFSELTTGANVWWRRVFRGINNWWNGLSSSSTGADAYFYRLKEVVTPITDWLLDWEQDTRAPSGTGAGRVRYSNPPTFAQLSTGENAWWRRIFRGITNWWNGLSSTSTGADAFFYRLKEVVTPITDWLLDWEQDTRAPSGTGAGRVRYSNPPTFAQLSTGENAWWKRILRAISLRPADVIGFLFPVGSIVTGAAAGIQQVLFGDSTQTVAAEIAAGWEQFWQDLGQTAHNANTALSTILNDIADFFTGDTATEGATKALDNLASVNINTPLKFASQNLPIPTYSVGRIGNRMQIRLSGSNDFEIVEGSNTMLSVDNSRIQANEKLLFGRGTVPGSNEVGMGADSSNNIYLKMPSLSQRLFIQSDPSLSNPINYLEVSFAGITIADSRQVYSSDPTLGQIRRVRDSSGRNDTLRVRTKRNNVESVKDFADIGTATSIPFSTLDNILRDGTTAIPPAFGDMVLLFDEGTSGDPLRRASVSSIVSAGISEPAVANLLSSADTDNSLNSGDYFIIARDSDLKRISYTELASDIRSGVTAPSPSFLTIDNILRGGATSITPTTRDSVLLFDEGSSSDPLRRASVSSIVALASSSGGGYSSGDSPTFSNVEINGDLNHDGSNIGFFGSTPVSRMAWTGGGLGQGNRSRFTSRELLGGSSNSALNNRLAITINKLDTLIGDLVRLGLF